MKKIILLFTSFLMVFIACDRELEIGSTFDFKINNIDDNNIFINTEKTFQLEIIDIKNLTENKDYQFTYKVKGGQLIVKNGTTTLISGNYYPIQTNNLNCKNLNLIPQSDGVITVEFFLKDNNGVEKSKEILVYCTDEDFSFNFTGTVQNPNGVVNQFIPFNLNVTNTGLSNNQFKIKYISSISGTVSVGGSDMPYNTFFNAPVGQIQGLYKSSNVGSHDVVFTCEDVNHHQIQVTLNFIIVATPFDLQKINNFSVKNTLKKPFQFNIFNTLPTATYQIKFSSLKSCKIFDGNTQLTLNNWHSITISPLNLYSYNYQALSDENDVLTVEVKDSYGQIKTIDYNITIFKRPKIITFSSSYNRIDGFCHSTNVGSNWNAKINCPYELYNSATLTKVRVVIKNKNSGTFDTLEFNNNGGYVYTISNQVIETGYVGGTCSGTYNWHLLYYVNYDQQPFTIDVLDSDGAWSESVSGIFNN